VIIWADRPQDKPEFVGRKISTGVKNLIEAKPLGQTRSGADPKDCVLAEVLDLGSRIIRTTEHGEEFAALQEIKCSMGLTFFRSVSWTGWLWVIFQLFHIGSASIFRFGRVRNAKNCGPDPMASGIFADRHSSELTIESAFRSIRAPIREF
jgi:hypothetical protein